MDYSMLSYDNMSQPHIRGATYFGYDPSKGKEPFKLTFSYSDALKKMTVLGRHSLFNAYQGNPVYDNPTSLETDPLRPVI